jgi:hypothetical protein
MAAPYNFLLELLDYIQTRLPTLNQALPPSCRGTHQSHLRALRCSHRPPRRTPTGPAGMRLDAMRA